MNWLKNPYFIYYHVFTSSDRMLSGKTRSDRLGSPRWSRNWFGQVNFRPRPLLQRDLPVYKLSYVAVATLRCPSTDTWSFLGLPPKACSRSFQHISSTTIVWHVTHYRHQPPRVSTTKNSFAELRMRLPAPLTAIGQQHKRSACLSG